MALVRSDPFRDVDRFLQQMWAGQNGTRSMAMPMDAYRKDDSFLLRLDLPGVSADSIDLTVEDNVLTVRAERPAPPISEGIEPVISERTYGTFTRQIMLGSNLDTEKMSWLTPRPDKPLYSYSDLYASLTLPRVPVAFPFDPACLVTDF